MKLLKFTLLITALGAAFGPIFCKKDFSYKAAGVLPYAIDAEGKVKFLLGLSSIHRDEASDFGGLRDDEDMHNPKITAAREGCEELMFIFDTDETFAKILALRNKYGRLFDIAKAGSSTYKKLYTALHKAPFSVHDNYHMHFIHIPYQENLPELFKHRKTMYNGLLPRCWNETTRLEWTEAHELLLAIDTRNYANRVTLKEFNLYEPFVQSIITARSQGIIADILRPSPNYSIAKAA